MIDNTKEYIICSAIHCDDKSIQIFRPRNISTGFVICGRRHHNCYATLSIFSFDRLKHNAVEGFLTSHDRFLNRKEALKLAVECEQLKSRDDIIASVLTSEDLW